MGRVGQSQHFENIASAHPFVVTPSQNGSHFRFTKRMWPHCLSNRNGQFSLDNTLLISTDANCCCYDSYNINNKEVFGRKFAPKCVKLEKLETSNSSDTSDDSDLKCLC